MPLDPDDPAFLWDMLDAARGVVEFVRGRSLPDYLADLMLRSAVEREVEIIGEAARKVSKGFKDEHPEIPWRGIISQRHVLAHNYGEIRHDRMWEVATIHIPALIAALTPLIPPEPQ